MVTLDGTQWDFLHEDSSFTHLYPHHFRRFLLWFDCQNRSREEPGSGRAQPGGRLLSCHRRPAAGVAGPSTRLQLHLLQPLMTVCTQEETRSYRDQGGTTANYTDHVLTEIAADNYVSQQTVEQSIILTAEQRRPVQAGPDDNEQSNSHLRRWRSCCSQISHLTTSRPLSFTEK